MNNKKAKIVMIAMFKNEARGLPSMLESCKPHVDYYVMQNNGSTDGSDEIAKNFLKENNLPGVVYDVEEGWVGFGWNRDHLIQYCQEQVDHGCDWILKMDCDEILQIDDDFDWSLLDDKEIQSFHIPAITGSCIYYRAWMWNARMKWRFNHDDCHETIRLVDPDLDGNFHRFDLPKSFRQIGFNLGESWTVPTKFVTDSLELEERLIRENNMLTDTYHFWYIGKSYNDSYRGDYFPLKESQQREYARRCIYYLTEYVKFMTRDTGPIFSEMCYYSLVLTADAYAFLEDHKTSLYYYEYSAQFSPGRNEHLFGIVRSAKATGDYKKMFDAASIMMDPNRKMPFPNYSFLIDSSIYIDSDGGGYLVRDAYNAAKILYENEVQPEEERIFNINKNKNKGLFVVNNFYSNPDVIRNYALSQQFKSDIRWYKGLRTTRTYRPESLKHTFEDIIGERITRWDYDMNGVFQITTSNDFQVYHHDTQKWAAMIYLTPNAPLESGTRLHSSKINGASHVRDGQELIDEAFSFGFYDSSKFNIVDSAGNLYNRLVIMDAMHIHSAGPYFGNTPENGRLTHLFFFD
jgi:glycosyltransferase involved in cell wall biosynthesis